MKRIALPLLIAVAMTFSIGCTTKKYVSRQVTPVMNKVDELDERTAQTTRGIRDLDERLGADAVTRGRLLRQSSTRSRGEPPDEASSLPSVD